MRCCLVLVVLGLLVAFGIGGWVAHQASSDNAAWCQRMEAFWADNPGDSNPKLQRAYAAQCP